MKIHLLGDSLVQPASTEFYTGWGPYLDCFFDKKIQVYNYAIGGRSTRGFINEGRFYDDSDKRPRNASYQPIPALNEIKKGDYVLISFLGNDDDSENPSYYRIIKKVKLGTPDEKGIYPVIVPDESMLSSANRWKERYPNYLEKEGVPPESIDRVGKIIDERMQQCGDMFFPYECEATYKGYLKFFIDMIREKEAVPILIASVAFHMFTEGKLISKPGFYGGSDEYNDFCYVEALKQLAKEENVPVIDLFTVTKSLYEDLGEELSSYVQNIKLSEDERSKIDAAVPKEYKNCGVNWCDEYDRRRSEGDFVGLDVHHSNRFGAFFQAALIADKLCEIDDLKEYALKAPVKKERIPQRLIEKKKMFEECLTNITI